ncbi:hypothetical protein ACVNIS_03170 [Sphaerotilaceae bacterium SBD11-9]
MKVGTSYTLPEFLAWTRRRLYVLLVLALVPVVLYRRLGQAWLAAPFSMLVGWMYLALDLVGESTENPFGGGANDVPTSQVSRQVEIELRQLLGDTERPPVLQPSYDILL